MEKNNSVIEILDTVLNDENFLLTILDQYQNFNDKHLYEVLAITLDYYLVTRDKLVNPNPTMIKTSFNELNYRTLTPKQIDNIITHGFLTHSFNGIERDYIIRYGFDYWDKISTEERKKLLHVREGLNRLESEIGKNNFQKFREEANEPEIVEKEIFLTVPGTKTVHYCKNTPERFYLGPVGIDSFDAFPIIAGETKKDYLMRILKYRIEHMTYDVNQEELIAIADFVTDYYTQKAPCISFVKIKDLIAKPVYTTYYGEGDGNTLRNYCEIISSGHLYPIHAFTTEPDDVYEKLGNIGNLVVLSTDIPKESLSLANFPDIYDLKQKYLKHRGIISGTLVDYYKCKEITSQDYIPQDIKRLYKGL